MFKISSTLAGVATIALATVPMLAIASGAHAAPVIVKVSDLDVSSAQGAQILNQRIAVAAREFCAQADPVNQGRLPSYACIKGVRAEVADSMAGRNAVMASARATTLAQR
jgi:UrcA family protein